MMSNAGMRLSCKLAGVFLFVPLTQIGGGNGLAFKLPLRNIHPTVKCKSAWYSHTGSTAGSSVMTARFAQTDIVLIRRR